MTTNNVQPFLSYEDELKPGDLLVWTEFPMNDKGQFLANINKQPNILIYFILKMIGPDEQPSKLVPDDFYAMLVGMERPVPYMKKWFHYPQVWIIPAP